MNKNKNEMPIESMVKNFALFDEKNAWIPLKIEEIEKIFSIKHADQEDYYVEKQIQYNLQYIEFMQKILNELFLTSTLPRMMYKYFTITAVSIIEICFYYVLKKEKHPNYKKLDLKEMLEYLEKHNILNYDLKSFPIFAILRKLRNHVHSFIRARENTSDYNEIKEEHYLLSKYTLSSVLSKVNSLKGTFEFLECTDAEKIKIFKFLKCSNLL